MITSNSGTNWTTQSSVGTGNFSGFVLFPAPVDYGYCWYTRNTTSIYRGSHGSNWAIEYTAPAGNYRHFTNVRNSGICFGVRSNGGITRCNYYFSGITQTGNSIPNNFGLFQNYPNPFNPVTKIKFSIPVRTIRRIIIKPRFTRGTPHSPYHLQPFHLGWLSLVV